MMTTRTTSQPRPQGLRPAATSRIRRRLVHMLAALDRIAIRGQLGPSFERRTDRGPERML